jgi:hypothetical protein
MICSISRSENIFYCKELMMTRSNNLRPAWPATLEAYDYLSGLAPRDWAWEGLRRNPKYQADARAFEHRETRTLGGGALLTLLQETSPRAEAWALCCFR